MRSSSDGKPNSRAHRRATETDPPPAARATHLRSNRRGSSDRAAANALPAGPKWRCADRRPKRGRDFTIIHQTHQHARRSARRHRAQFAAMRDRLAQQFGARSRRPRPCHASTPALAFDRLRQRVGELRERDRAAPPSAQPAAPAPPRSAPRQRSRARHLADAQAPPAPRTSHTGAGRAAPRCSKRRARSQVSAQAARGDASKVPPAPPARLASRANSHRSAINPPASVSRNGRPCDTAGAMPQRASLASTRRANAASGVDQGRAALRRLQRFAQHQRDRRRLFVLRRRFQQTQALRAALARSAPPPASASTRQPVGRLLRRRQGFAHQHAPARPPRSVSAHSSWDRVARDAKRCAASASAHVGDADRRSHPKIASSRSTSTPGNTTTPARQARHHPHQIARRRDRAGGAGDDDRPLRRLRLPRAPAPRNISARRAARIGQTLRFRRCGQYSAMMLEKLRRRFPMPRQIALFAPASRSLLPMRPRPPPPRYQAACASSSASASARAGSSTPPLRLVARADERRQFHALAHRLDRRRHVERRSARRPRYRHRRRDRRADGSPATAPRRRAAAANASISPRAARRFGNSTSASESANGSPFAHKRGDHRVRQQFEKRRRGGRGAQTRRRAVEQAAEAVAS